MSSDQVAGENGCESNKTITDFHFMIGFLSNDDIKISVYKCHKMFIVSYNELRH